MKKVILLFLALLFAQIAFADITVTTDQPIYNLGDKIKATASVMQDIDFEGLFKLTIQCDNSHLQYFLTPISLEADFRTAVDVPDLVATSSMIGNCAITGSLLTNNELEIDRKESDAFEVAYRLSVLPVRTSITALPGENIAISGVVNEAYGNNVLKATVKISLGPDSYEVEAIDGKFDFILLLAKNIKSGGHEISISATDPKHNFGNALIPLEITPIPTYIKNELSEEQVSPGLRIYITSSLYDQADDLINASLGLELWHGEENIFKKTASSNEKIDYEFSQYADPGTYTLSSSYKNLLTKSVINVSTVREVKVKYGNETVVVENVGNIPYEDELTFILQSAEKKFPVTKKIRIEAGKILSIDLSKEVPQGIYNVIVPLKDGFKPIQDELNATLQGILPKDQNVLAADVEIHDNRPIYKKIGTGLSSISGALIGADGVLTQNPLIGPGILAIIVLALVVRYGGKPIMNLIKGKKEEDKKDDEI